MEPRSHRHLTLLAGGKRGPHPSYDPRSEPSFTDRSDEPDTFTAAVRSFHQGEEKP